MTTTSVPRPALSLEQMAFLQEAVGSVAALAAADRLGVLARLDAGPADPAAVARDCAIGERGARALLAALVGLQLVAQTDDGRFYATIPQLGRIAGLLAQWDVLAEVIRHDRPLAAGNTPAGAETLYRETVADLGAWMAPVAAAAAAHLAAPGLRVLDVGAGAAPWSLAVAAHAPGVQVTAVDLPAVLPAARRAVAAAGYESQFSFLGGDLFSLDWGAAGYDLAIAGNICHLFDETANRRLLARLFEALRPGGRLAILDVLPNERLDGPRPVVLYALGLLLRTQHGTVYPFTTYMAWLREAGFHMIERTELSSVFPMSLLTAGRP